MFNKQNRQAGNSVGKNAANKLISVAGVVGIIGALAVAAPATASPSNSTATWAQGQFLTGTLAGVNLNSIAGLTPATARNSGDHEVMEVKDPLAVNLLGTQALDVGAVRVSPDSVLDTQTLGGALSQYARAERTGVAMGASGTIGEGGAVGPDESNPSGALSLSLGSLLGTSYNSVVSDLTLAVRAVAANAKGTLETVNGDYYIDGLTLTFTSPALASLSSTITKAASAADAKLDALSGRNGEIAVALNTLLVAIDPALNIAGDAKVSVTLGHNLRAAVAELLSKSWGGSGVSFNVTTGKVSVDLNALLGARLNNLPPNSEILTSANVNAIVSTITQNVEALAGQALARVNAALENLKLDVDADVMLLTDQAPILGQTCHYVDGNGNILSEILGKLLGKLVCTPTSTLLPKLKTSVSVDVHGTVAQVLSGSSPVTAQAQVLGIPVKISTGKILTVLSGILKHRIYETGGILPTLKGQLLGPLLARANTGLVGATGLQAVLSDILSIRVNLQQLTLSGGGFAVPTNAKFTETAMRVSVASMPGSAGLTTLSLASASVAPSVKSATTGDPGDPGGPGEPGTHGYPGDPGTTPAGEVGSESTGAGGLAYTGVAIGSALAALLALLMSGAWLARKGYRRNHPTLEP